MTKEIPKPVEEAKKEIPLTVAKLIEKLSEIENKEIPITSFRGDGFKMLTATELFSSFREIYLGEDLKESVFCLNANQIRAEEEYDGEGEETSIIEISAEIIDNLEFVGGVLNNMAASEDGYVVTNLDSLADFHKHKGRAIRHIAEAIHNIALMSDVVMVDMDLENYIATEKEKEEVGASA